MSFKFNSPAIKEGDSKFVKVLKTVMYEKKMGQVQLAELLGIRQSQVSNWINGKSLPSYPYMQLIKDKLGLPVETYYV